MAIREIPQSVLKTDFTSKSAPSPFCLERGYKIKKFSRLSLRKFLSPKVRTQKLFSYNVKYCFETSPILKKIELKNKKKTMENFSNGLADYKLFLMNR